MIHTNFEGIPCTLIKKQRLKKCFTSYLQKKNITLPYQLCFVSLVNFRLKIDDDYKFVKVKLRWTFAYQMEVGKSTSTFIQPENTPSVNNFSQPTETMAITPVNSINMPIITENTNKPHMLKSCHIVLQKCNDSAPSKRKRGRPKKVNLKNENEMPKASSIISENVVLVKAKSMSIVKDNNDSNINSNLLTDFKPDDSSLQIKKRRGRPRKVTSNTDEKCQILSNTTLKKRGRRKKCVSVIEHTENHINSALDNKVTVEMSDVPTLDKINGHVSSEYTNQIYFDDIDKIINVNSIMEPEIHLYRFDDKLPYCSNLSEITKSLEFKEINKSQFSNNIQLNLSPELNKINSNFEPKQKRSKSCENVPKIRQRKNSLSDDFVFGSVDTVTDINESNILNKFWKSLSFLQGGPNILSERYQRKQLNKKFRSDLKRSRSFPNCMLLDTVIWRYLIYHQTYNVDECFEEMSATDNNLTNELPDDEHHREYRSKSEPICNLRYKNEKGKNNYTSKSQNDLNMLSDDNYISITSLQKFSNEYDFENTTKNELQNSENKIRRSKRLHTKIKDTDMLEESCLLESNKPDIDYLLLATQIREDNERQLLEARKNDPELDERLKKLNFTFISNNLFRPNRKSMSLYTPAEVLELRKLKPKRTINGDAFNCHCKYSKEDWIEGKPGCGSECLNRLLNIECGSSCSLNNFCTNKQFQNKQFKRTEIVKTPGKGYGVFALEDIPGGSFVDEYIGEVIDQHEMIKRMRKKMYINNNYMVQLKHDEIIDATRKGNITRFINHSCEPNCVAEKWNILGESRMGFFSKDLIRKGEEITFDYSFELFGDTKQQVCYCGTSKCRGFISKKSRTFYDYNDNNDNGDTQMSATSKQEELKEKKPKILTKKTTHKISKRLQELDQQLTDISKLKNKNRSDLESSTLNLNKLMVHISDSMSQSHILKFIRENDLNCKRLFMNFNGLSIIHSWMVSSNNETLKLEIIQTLSDLPISNRNTISKSKVLDIVADWAKIPLNTKKIIESLDYPESKYEEHLIEVNNLLPDENNISELIRSSRILWKKWIILKMVFKIPKLERPKEVIVPEILNHDTSTSIIIPPSRPKTVQYHFGKPAVSNHSTKIVYGSIKSKFQYIKFIPNQKPNDSVNKNSIDTFIKIINNQNQIVSRDKNKAVFEWNKSHRECTALKTNSTKIIQTNNNTKTNNDNTKTNNDATKTNNDVTKTNNDTTKTNNNTKTINDNTKTHDNAITKKKPITNKKIKKVSKVNTEPLLFEDIPTIVSDNTNNKQKLYFAPVSSVVLPQPIKKLKFIDTKTETYPIEVIISNKKWSLPVPTVYDLNNKSTLNSILKVPPPNLPNKYKTSVCDVTREDSCSFKSALTIMCPENVCYDARHPSREEQLSLMPIQELKNSNTFLLDLSITNLKEEEERREKKLFKLCANNLKKLCNQGLLDVLKSPKKNYVDCSPIKLFPSLFKKKTPISQLQLTNEPTPFKNLFKFLKIRSNLYQNQPSNLIKINYFNSARVSQENRKNVFRIKEKSSIKSDSITTALKLHNKPLNTTPKHVNINKLLNKQRIEIKTENTFANKILKGLMKKCSTMPKHFTLQLPEDTKIYTLNSKKEVELHNKLIPSVDNELCAVLKNNGNALNVFKQKLCMIYDESKLPESISDLRSITKGSQILLKSIEDNRKNVASLKRKLPLPPMENIKRPKKVASINQIRKLNNKVSKPTSNQINESVLFKKPVLPDLNEEKYFSINTIIGCREQITNTSDQITKNNLSSKTIANEFIQKPDTPNQSIFSTIQSEINSNEIRPKPLMKCLPFNKLDCTSVEELELNARNLAISLSKSYSNNAPSLNNSNVELIGPIVDTFNDFKKPMNRVNIVNDPIVRDYVQQCTQTKNLEPKRSCKLPDSMMSLPTEVLDLIPDNQREIKYVVDFYHSMATVIVKILDSYVKKNCKQGRIRNDQDFKYLAKKLNSNILFKELQVKSVEDLRISDSVKAKVEQYIKKYMLKYGKVYKRKHTDL